MRFKAFICIFYATFGICFLSAHQYATAWNVLSDAALNAKSPDHRKQAVAALGAIGPAPDVVKLLEQILAKDGDTMVRQTAAQALGDMKATEAIPALQAALDDPSGEVAFSAAKALWDLGDPAGKRTFEEIMTGERKNSKGFIGGTMDDAKRTLRDPKKLAYVGIKDASGVLLGPMSMGIGVTHDVLKEKDTSATGRALAVEYLAKDCDARSVQLFQWTLSEDLHWIVKAAAARGLGKCGTEADIPLLEKYLDDSHEPLKYQAAAAIVRLGLKPAQVQPSASLH